uniref:Uncharacterized protein n=1 Tax=Chromera velia CCMP2878 TaxID=1169474 RepID=A0A0G4HU31_9ALVE|eukprot:Cvel_8580.t1-p1 / transcript=Cvel_8580.t1 / gene=Cvel_8580 / organism=Chromera_velia_CCMP2878 / gene_product=hypothetical protein / transcript_product=hypothetical protein / location=Cvel_scaffold476:34425-34955(-) / protein_length=177 / sequence_SO=supercontig / SO=protein_coding / is_pseudo=false
MDDFVVAAVVVGSGLATVSQLLGVCTVRARVSALRLATPEDTEQIAERKPSSQPADLRAFLCCFRYICCITCFSPVSDSYFERLTNMHRHATENNTSLGLVLFSSWLALTRCEERGGDCDPIARFGTVVAYTHLGCRLLHLLFYAIAIRQPYRALAFIASNISLGLLLRVTVMALTS